MTGWRSTLMAVAALAAFSLAGVPTATADTPVVKTFESDTVGQVPAGCSTPSGKTAATVSGTRAYSGTKSLRLLDSSASTATVVQCPVASRTNLGLSLRFYPAALPNGFLIDVLGTFRGIAGTQPVYHLAVDADGGIRWYDAFNWTQVAPAGTVHTGQWSKLTLDAPTGLTAQHVYLNGSYLRDAGPNGQRDISAVTGFALDSYGTAPTGDDVYVDDVSYGPPENPEPAPIGPFTAGPARTITSSSTPVQMPNTAITVPHGSGTRVLVSHPAHTDDSASNGNRLVYSDDGGQTWVQDQASNPMPDAPSYGLTRLRDGRLLAVDYHTYMVAGSNNTQAEVDQAISTDNGATWTTHNGTMTTQAMRTISSVTDRPGVPLGGFVLVHSVVEDADGTLYQSGYGYYQQDTKYRQIVLKSTDVGLHWTVAATVAVDPNFSTSPNFEGFDEGAIARVADGSLLIVMRIGSYLPMYTARSTDNGATWSTPAQLTAGLPVVGVYPTLTLLPNGKLILLVGRPGLALLESADGSGAQWTARQVVDYLNSANGTFVPLSCSHLLVFGDRGADWARPAAPDPYAVWVRDVTL